jgi:DNA-binding transcriptional ArsR family regulator
MLKTEKELLDEFERLVRAKLPVGWSLRVEREPAGIPGEPDARLVLLPPGGDPLELLVGVRTRLEPRDVKRISERLDKARTGGAAWAMIAPFVSPMVRTRLENAGLGYADATGTASLGLSSASSSFTLSSVGATTNPWPEKRPLNSLKGPASARVVRALCDFSPPYGVTELAERSGASAPVVSRVLGVLDSEGLIERAKRGPVTGLDWPGLLERWSQDYGFSESNQVRSCLEPRGPEALFAKLTSANLTYALTGPAATRHLTQVAAERSVALFVGDLAQARRALELTEVEAGANVLLAEPFDPVVFERSAQRDGLTMVAPSQAAVDMLTGPGRWPAQGQALIAWMKEHENAWRS